MLRFSSCDVVLQEVPNEISLCFTITGCQLACEGCHSEYIWNPENGKELSQELFRRLIIKYKPTISCILFMGGEWRNQELLGLIRTAKLEQLKVALYTGLNIKQVHRKYPELLDELDFIKTGKWISKLGGLDSPTTNQEFLDIKSGEILNQYFQVKNQS